MPSSVRLVYECIPDEKKKQLKRHLQIKNGTTKYSKSIGGSIWLGSKGPF